MKKILILLLFCQTVFGQNTIFKNKVPFVNYYVNGLFEAEQILFYNTEANIDSILSKNPNLKINFNKPFILEKPLTQVQGKINYPIYALVFPNDTIALEKEIRSNYQVEVDLVNKLSFDQEWLRKHKNNYSNAQKDSIAKSIIKMQSALQDSLFRRRLFNDYQLFTTDKIQDYTLLAKYERISKLDSSKDKIRAEAYGILRKIIDIIYFTEKNQSNSVQRIFVTEVIRFDSTSISLDEIEKEFELINSIKPEEYQIYGFLIRPYLESVCRLLTAKINDNLILEKKGLDINSKLNLPFRDLFMSNFVHNLARTSRLSMRLLYDFYDNCEEQSEIEMVHNSVSYGRLTANDAELKQTKLATLDGESINWGELLALNKGKIVYDVILDEVNESSIVLIKKVKVFKEKNKDVIINFITKAANEENWIGIISKLGILSLGKHYRLDLEPILTRVLTENVMPRGVLVSKEARIVSIHSNDPEAEYFTEFLKEAYEF
jgi:hypothetical protein